jgi:hypothetical protein
VGDGESGALDREIPLCLLSHAQSLSDRCITVFGPNGEGKVVRTEKSLQKRSRGDPIDRPITCSPPPSFVRREVDI